MPALWSMTNVARMYGSVTRSLCNRNHEVFQYDTETGVAGSYCYFYPCPRRCPGRMSTAGRLVTLACGLGVVRSMCTPVTLWKYREVFLHTGNTERRIWTPYSRTCLAWSLTRLLVMAERLMSITHDLEIVIFICNPVTVTFV